MRCSFVLLSLVFSLAWVRGGTLPPGTTLEIQADGEHLGVRNPAAIAFGDDGRLFVVESDRAKRGGEEDRGRFDGYLDDLAARTVDDRRTLQEKWQKKVPPGKFQKPSEVIRVLTDENGDGKADKAEIFADGFSDEVTGTAPGIAVYEGEVYFAGTPKILALRDSDKDGKADKTTTLLEGFGVHISYAGHDLNGFTLGPDGRLWGTIGDRGFHVITKEGLTYQFPDTGTVFRFDPDGSNFEVVHTGLRNPQGIAFDEKGNAFTVDSNVDQGDEARLIYVAEGGDSGWERQHQAMHSFYREIGLEKRPPNRWMEEKMGHVAGAGQPAWILPPVAHLTRGPSALAYHPGTGFLESERGRFLVCDYRGGVANSRVISFAVEPEGAGMKLADSRELLKGIAVSDLEYSWDGRLFLADFGYGQSASRGKIYSLAAQKRWKAEDSDSTARIVKEGFEQRTSVELAVLLKHPDLRVRLRAQLSLTRKADAFERLSKAAESGDRYARIHGIRGLGILARRGPAALPPREFGSLPAHQVRAASEAVLVKLLGEKDEEIRVMALKALIDSSGKGAARLEIAPLFDDPSPQVVYHTVILAGKRGMVEFYGDICDMLEKNAGKDRYLSHAGAYALSLFAKYPGILASLREHSSESVRLAAVVGMRRTKDPGLALFVRDHSPTVVEEAIRAACDLEISSARAAALALFGDDKAAQQFSPIMQRRLVHAAFRAGTAADLRRLFEVAGNPVFPETVRTEVLRLLGQWKMPFPVNQFTGHWSPLPQRDAAVFDAAVAEWAPQLLADRSAVLAASLDFLANAAPERVDVEFAAKLAVDANALVPNRASAIRFLAGNHPARLETLSPVLIVDSSPEIAFPAIALLCERAPEKAIPRVREIFASPSFPLGQRIVGFLGSHNDPAFDALLIEQLDSIAAKIGRSPLADEILDWGKSRSANSQVSAALAKYEAVVKAHEDPLAAWFPALQGGDPERGKALFDSHSTAGCVRCHTVNGTTTAAPDLADVASRHGDPRYFLESLLRPNAVIASGFSEVALTLNNDGHFGGLLIDSSPDSLVIENHGKHWRVSRADIKTSTTPVSPMPAVESVLKPKEIRDLVAWLTTLKKAVPESVSAPEILPFDPQSVAPEPKLPAEITTTELLAKGKIQYLICAACHGQKGEGTGAGPPLAGSEWITGDPETLIRIQLRGLTGPLKVKGASYDFPAGMAPLAYQNNEQIAAVLTYVRGNFGNDAPPIFPAQVEALRGEVGQPMLQAAEVSPQFSAPAGTAPGSDKYADLANPSAGNGKKIGIVLAGILAILGLCVAMKKTT